MPCADTEAARYSAGPQGNGIFRQDRHRPHWADCPDAEQHRKPRQQGELF